jgi:hypothetical protein
VARRVTATETAPGVQAPPRRLRLTPRWKTTIALAIIALAFAIPLRGLLRSQGPPMEEGFMLTFPERVLAGDVPNVDFLHLYGPGSLWVLAGVYKVFGTTLTVERLFGLLQQIAVVLGMFALARYWGRTAAVLCGLIALVIIVPPIGLTALAWSGGVGLALLGLAAILHGRHQLAVAPATACRFAVLGGIVAGFALLYRLDLVLAVGASGLVAIWGTGRRFTVRALVGYAIGVSGYLVHLAMAGIRPVVDGMVIDPVFNLRGGRKLPAPPPWDHLDGFLQKSAAILPSEWPLPQLETSQQLFVWFFLLLAVVAFLVGAAIWDVRRDRTRIEARVLLAGAVFSLGMLPQGLQRVDSAHFSWVSCVPFALIPLAALELARARRPEGTRLRRRSLAAGLGVLAAVILVIPQFTAWAYTDYSLQTFGRHRLAFEIEHDGRVFYYGRDGVARAANELLTFVPTITRPGDRLFVGTTDLRKTPLSEAYLYYMLPELTPATYYIEMDPGVANAKGSGLASDLASADVAILSSVWNAWDEPNDSRKLGSDAANRVLKRDFCLVRTFGEHAEYELYRRCR